MEKQQITFQHESQLLKTRLEVQELALNKVSQEIHDNIGQSLSIAQINLNILAEASDRPKNRLLIETSRTVLAKALTDLRNISHILNTEYVNSIGLEEALRKEIGHLETHNRISFGLYTDGDSDDLTNEQELMIFRIAQEALTNIIKHAKATVVDIQINYHPDVFEMSITDNGGGFSEEATSAGGIGLLNMRQRAQIMEGVLQIVPGKSGGTEVKLVLPRV